MKIKEGFIVREIEDAVVAVPTGKLLNEFNCIINLNKYGKFMWKLLENETTLEELVNELIKEFDLTKEDAEKKAKKFTEGLRNNKFLEPVRVGVPDDPKTEI